MRPSLCDLEALRGPSGDATMNTPGGTGTLWSMSQLPVLGAPASSIGSELPQPRRGGLRPFPRSQPVRYRVLQGSVAEVVSLDRGKMPLLCTHTNGHRLAPPHR